RGTYTRATLHRPKDYCSAPSEARHWRAQGLARRGTLSRSRPALIEQFPDLGHQLARRERLDDIDVGARRQSPADLRVAPTGGKHDDLDISPVGALAHLRAHFVTALLRHHHVEQHQIGMRSFDKTERFFAVTGHADIVAIALQEEFERCDDARLVVRNQDLPTHDVAPVGSVNEKRAPVPSW